FEEPVGWGHAIDGAPRVERLGGHDGGGEYPFGGAGSADPRSEALSCACPGEAAGRGLDLADLSALGRPDQVAGQALLERTVEALPLDERDGGDLDRCGAGSSSSSSSIGAHSWCSAANASSISNWTAVTLMTRQSAARWVRYPSNAVLPTPASPRITRQRLSPRRSASRRESSSRRSASRPMSRVALRSDEECAD